MKKKTPIKSQLRKLIKKTVKLFLNGDGEDRKWILKKI